MDKSNFIASEDIKELYKIAKDIYTLRVKNIDKLKDKTYKLLALSLAVIAATIAPEIEAKIVSKPVQLLFWYPTDTVPEEMERQALFA